MTKTGVDSVIKWGIISTANIGRAAVIPALHAAANCEVTAVASRNLESAKTFAENNNIPVSYGNYESLLKDPTIDAVYIPLPNSMHMEWTIKAAEHGKHILCEKPLALNAAECLQMKQAAEKNNVKLMEAFMYRFHPQTRKVTEMIRNGAVGELKMIESSFTFKLRNENNIRYSPELGGGSLMDVGCYCVNVTTLLAGRKPLEVQAKANWSKSGVDAEMMGYLGFSDGLMAQFRSALTLHRFESYTAAGTQGSIQSTSAFLPGKGDTTVIHCHEDRGEQDVDISGADEYELMVSHFSDCVINDRQPEYSIDESIINMNVIEALYFSARNNGKVVTL